jgi:transposase
VSNIELALAKKYNAVAVREHLTVEAIEKEAPEYKGPAFNKMLNNGSKGQYQNGTTDKFQWNGIPEIEVPSWYTSRSCLTHSQVLDKKHRQGEKIYVPCCDKHEHADEHAADTIGGLLFLRPIKELARASL